jgi:cell division protease FtsH
VQNRTDEIASHEIAFGSLNLSDSRGGKRKTAAVWVVLIVAFVVFFSLQSASRQPRRASFEQFREAVGDGAVREVWVDGNQIVFQLFSESDRQQTTGLVDAELQQELLKEGTPFHHSAPPAESSSNAWLVWILIPGVIVVVVLLFLRARAKKGGLFGVQVSELRKSRAVLVDGKRNVTFADVGGCEEAKTALGDVIDFLKQPQRWIAAGARLPRGILLDGPPGCGKTLLARAVAGESDAKFYSVSGSEFVELFIGVGAARVRDMFETAAKNAPAIIFIDELDAVGRRRGGEITIAGHNEREQTLNQLLVNLDGFKANDRVVVLAATNRPEILDPALLRPGRFDRQVRVPELSRAARREVLVIHTGNKRLAAGISLDDWADATAGFTGAQLEGLANEAALLAVRRLRDNLAAEIAISREDFAKALETLRPKSSQFDRLDELLLEANHQVARPAGKAVVRVTMTDGAVHEGEVEWVDAGFLKIRNPDAEVTIVPKRHIIKMSAVNGAEVSAAMDLTNGRRSRHEPETM